VRKDRKANATAANSALTGKLSDGTSLLLSEWKAAAVVVAAQSASDRFADPDDPWEELPPRVAQAAVCDGLPGSGGVAVVRA